MRSSRLALGVVAATTALAAIAPAAGADGLSISRAGSGFPDVAYTLRAPDGVALDSTTVQLTENGKPVDALAVESAAGEAGASFATVLVIDATETMRGDPIAEAMEAARAFAAHRAPDQRLAVLSFNEDTTTLLPFSTDDAEIAAALEEEPAIATSTDLYEATDVAITMLGEAGVKAGSVVVLSDGADTGTSAVDLADVAAAAEDSGVRIFTVGLRSKATDIGALRDLAVGGAFADAERPQELASIFDRFGAQLASEYLLRYTSPARPGEGVTVEVEVTGVSGAARAYYDAPNDSSEASADPVATGGFWESRGAMVVAVVFATSLLGTALILLLRPQRETARDRVARFLRAQATDERDEASEPEGSARWGATLASIERSFEGRDWWRRLNEDLDVAGIELSAMRLLAGTVLGTAFAALLLGQVIGVPILAPLSLLVPLGVRMWLNRQLRVKRDEFADQLADNLQLVVSALRAGQSMAGALAVVVEEADEPARTEFRRIVNDERLGVPLEDALRDVARRMDNRDMEQVALVATIQREIGGNTAEVLEQVIETIRERGKLRRLMKTLTAQGRLTQGVISALPLGLLLAITLINRDYLAPLFETGGGRVVLGVGAGLSIVGSLIIKRIVEVRI